MPERLADWQLPEGVNRGLWDYLHDTQLARSYDEGLRETPLLQVDQRFVEQYCPQPGRLIDLGCGTGRILLPLAQRGFWVLGVDLSEPMLTIVGEKARAAGTEVHRLKANLVHLEGIASASFDYAVCLFSTLGMIAGAEQRRRVVAQVQRLLKPQGRFILHVHNRWFSFWNPHGRRWLLWDLTRSWRNLPTAGDRDMPAHDGQSRLTLHLFTRREILRLLRQSGFRVLECRPVSLRPDGVLPYRWWFGAWRAYGYLIVAEKM